MDLWISNNRGVFKDIHNSCLDIHKSNYWYPIFNCFLDIQKWFMDIQKSGCILGYPLFIFGYPKIELWISSNQLIFGYPKVYFRKSINRFLDIQKWIMDIQKYIFRCPKMNFGIHKYGINSKTAPYRAPDVSASRRFGTKPLNTPRCFETKTFRHQNISTQDGWMDGWNKIHVFQLLVLCSHV